MTAGTRVADEAIGPVAPPLAGGHVPEVGTQATYAARAGALLRSRVPDVLIVIVGSATLDFLRALPLLSATAIPVPLLLLNMIATGSVKSAAAVVGVTLAEAVPPRGWRRVGLMILGGWAGVLVALAVDVVLALNFGWIIVLSDGLVASLASYLMYVGWEYMAISTAVALFYAAREREVNLTRSARAAELSRGEVERSVIEARLDVLRARVEPEFLFGALYEVRRLYARDRSAAEALIDALIAYLRAALPRMRGGGSTAGREVAFARAYAAVLHVPRGELLSVDTDVTESAEDVAVPPMLLLPLAQAALASTDVDARRRFAIAAAAVAGQIVIDVAVDGGIRPAAWRDGGPETVRRTLQAYYGDEARLEFASDGSRHRATLRLPADAIVAPRGAVEKALSHSPQEASGAG